MTANSEGETATGPSKVSPDQPDILWNTIQQWLETRFETLATKTDVSKLSQRLELIEADAAIARQVGLKHAGAGPYRPLPGSESGWARGDTQVRIIGHGADPSKRKRAEPALY